ncbi:MAG: hypothetical protein DCC75_06520 [Proteobacteria bacterium]|nr:MAG: hypothetical protein DCC75_06520 [Pseudomonadota bacterium]
MIKKVQRNAFVLSSILIFACPAWAEEAARGRLPDGRAFRTDAEGVQLVDYIAELELNIDSLNRRVYGLEDEVKAKQEIISRLETGRAAASPALKERDMLAEAVLAEAPVEKQPEPVGRQVPVPDDCQPKLAAVSQEVDALRASLEVEKQIKDKEIAELNGQLANLKLNLQQNEARSSELSAKLLEKTAQTQPVLQHDTKAGLSMAKLRALESIRGQLNTDLNQARGRLRTRDKMIASYNSKERAVGLKFVRPISSRGYSIDEVAGKMEGAKSVYELNTFAKDIREIEAKIQDDIALLGRMAK